MKQVFPEVRPRRLGTRGHSRYCYAAMRKTTKLTPPQIPFICTSSIANESEKISAIGSLTGIENNSKQMKDTHSWNIIKTWAQNILNVQIENIDSLANLIAQKNLQLPAVQSRNTSTEKKASQRGETKEKRLLAVSPFHIFLKLYHFKKLYDHYRLHDVVQLHWATHILTHPLTYLLTHSLTNINVWVLLDV